MVLYRKSRMAVLGSNFPLLCRNRNRSSTETRWCSQAADAALRNQILTSVSKLLDEGDVDDLVQDFPPFGIIALDLRPEITF